MTQPTLTLPQEVVQQALDALEWHTVDWDKDYLPKGYPEKISRSAIADLYAALDAPAKPPCQMCKHYAPGDESNDGICLTSNCTDFDKFQALPPISLAKVTK